VLEVPLVLEAPPAALDVEPPSPPVEWVVAPEPAQPTATSTSANAHGIGFSRIALGTKVEGCEVLVIMWAPNEQRRRSTWPKKCAHPSRDSFTMQRALAGTRAKPFWK
jgi:hypothetical protein